MGKSDNIIKFEEVLKAKDKREAYEAALKKIVEEKSAKSDGEAIQKAAKVLGFDLSREDLERSYAAKQDMDDDELDAVAGGVCVYDHSCFTAWKHDEDDACLYDYYCITVAHHNCTGNNYMPPE